MRSTSRHAVTPFTRSASSAAAGNGAHQTGSRTERDPRSCRPCRHSPANCPPPLRLSHRCIMYNAFLARLSKYLIHNEVKLKTAANPHQPRFNLKQHSSDELCTCFAHSLFRHQHHRVVFYRVIRIALLYFCNLVKNTVPSNFPFSSPVSRQSLLCNAVRWARSKTVQCARNCRSLQKTPWLRLHLVLKCVLSNKITDRQAWHIAVYACVYLASPRCPADQFNSILFV